MTDNTNSNRHRHQMDSQYACIPKFQNTLPAAPSGPFFGQVPLQFSRQDYAEYRVSTLEKGYVWPVHMPYDVGMNLNLVDPEKVLVNEEDKYVPLDPLDLAYMASGKSSSLVESQPNWLRYTTYTTNQITGGNNIKKGKKRGADEVGKSVGMNLVGTDKNKAEASFDTTEKRINELERASKNAKIAHVSNFLPDINLWSTHMSLVSLSENPYSTKDEDAKAQGTSKLKEAILTNIHVVKGLQGDMACSLVVPADKEAIDLPGGRGVGIPYEWTKDYKLGVDTKQSVESDIFAVYLKKNAISTFAPIRQRLDCKKLERSIVEHECVVIRREKEADAEISLAEQYSEEVATAS